MKHHMWRYLGLAQEKALPKLDKYLTDFQALDIKQTEI